MSFTNSIVGGQGALVRPAIKSPNYITGVSGWSINKDGSAEFSNLTIRGTFFGTRYIINSSGMFFYSGTPANGNLVLSVASAAGTDSFGNAYLSGFVSYGDPLGNDITTQLSGGLFSLVSNFSGASTVLDFDGMALTNSSIIGNYERSRIRFRSANDDPVVNDPGGLQWVINDVSEIQRYLVLRSGDDVSHAACWAWLYSEDASNNAPYFKIDNAANAQVNFRNGSVDQGRGIQSSVSISSNVTGIPANTETNLMTCPSMTFVAGRAYRITINGRHESGAASDRLLYRVRKGSASTSGNLWIDAVRLITATTAGQVTAVNMAFILENNTGSDITTAVSINANPALGTASFQTSSTDLAYATIEDVGVASAWPGVSIT